MFLVSAKSQRLPTQEPAAFSSAVPCSFLQNPLSKPRPEGNWLSGFLSVAMVLVLAAAVLGAKTETAYTVGNLCSDDEVVRYKMTFQGNFNSASSPGGLPHIARFTQIIWVTHTSQKTFWKPGGMASPGVEDVAELGETFTFVDEVIDEVIEDTVNLWDFFPYGRYPRGEETLSRVIPLCKKAPLVTFLAMLDFSPDWFIGVSSYSLLNSQNNWISPVTLDLYPYDAGTEEGTEFSFNNPPSNPHVPISSLRGKGKFSGATAPVARMTLERINAVNLLVNKSKMTEGDGALSITATLARNNASGSALSIPLVSGSGTTAQSGDYTVQSSISIADGAKSGSGSFAAVDDGTDEPSETVVIKLGNSLSGGIVAGSQSTITITIEDNDATVANLGRSDSGAVAEGGTGVKADAEFTVTLSRALAAGERIDVPLVLSGSGVTAGDFSLAKKSGGSLNNGVTVSGSDTLTPTVIFQNAGARTATLVLTPTDDSHIESDETLTVALGPDGSGTNGFDRAGLGTNVGGGANPHGSSNSFDVVIESDDTAPPTVPLVSISGGNAVTEGESATFTLTASPAPSSAISVKVTIADSGSFAASGQTNPPRSVTIGTGGTASLTVTTVNDSADELDGTITATLGTGSGYGIGSPNSASVTVRDDDDPTPVITISGGSAVTEGESATFILTASPAPSSDISVRVMITDSGSFATNGQTGSKKVTIDTGGTASLTVTTVNDSADEPDGTITATVEAGTGYSAGSPGSASVTVEDDDDPTPVITISGGNAVTEGESATFTLTASPAPSSSSVFVKVTVSDSGNFAVIGQTGSRRVTIGTEGTASLTVTTVNNNADDDGTIIATVEAGTSYSVGSPRFASVTVKDDSDPTPATDAVSGDTDTVSGDTEDVTSPDRGALLEIYKASGGASWTRNGNWNSDAPIALWYGVSADSDGRVVELLLEDNNLSGTIHQDIGKLKRLEVLYMNDNSLTGTIPAEKLETLSSLKELSLWGNTGLRGTINDELGKRVDRAVLRKLRDVNGSSLQGWFAQDETVFDYSGWQGIGVNSDDRVSGLDLSASGLRGDITDAVWELSDIERLDVSDNPDLTGELPQRIADTALEYVDISGSGLCAPKQQWFTQWVDDNDIVFTDRGFKFETTDNDTCGQNSEPTQTTGAGGGGCSVASGGGFRQSITEFALGIFVLGMMLLAGRRNAQHENGIQTKKNKHKKYLLK